MNKIKVIFRKIAALSILAAGLVCLNPICQVYLFADEPENNLLTEPVEIITSGGIIKYNANRFKAGLWPTRTSNSLSGITLNTLIDWTGLDAWWPHSNGYITRSSAWTFEGEVSSISNLRPGDVIIWAEGSDVSSEYDWVNHIAIITEVARDESYFITADGNLDTHTGCDFSKYTELRRRNSTYGKVLVWRNNENGDTIAASVKEFTQKIIDDNDLSMKRQWDFEWCFCFAVTALLDVHEVNQNSEHVIFEDVTDPSQYYYSHVYWAAELGITNGMPGGVIFGADEPCTRDQFAMFIWKLKGRPEPTKEQINTAEAAFSDFGRLSTVNYRKAVAWAYANGIVEGYTQGEQAGTFGVDKSITRREAVIMLWRSAGWPEPGQDNLSGYFTDFKDISKSSATYNSTIWAYNNGILNGYKKQKDIPSGCDYIAPCAGFDIECFRKDMITLLHRAEEYLVALRSE